jgi:hypothetical protein
VALPGQATDDASVEVALQSETSAAGSVRIAISTAPPIYIVTGEVWLDPIDIGDLALPAISGDIDARPEVAGTKDLSTDTGGDIDLTPEVAGDV